jgi:hypothetical protein
LSAWSIHWLFGFFFNILPLFKSLSAFAKISLCLAAQVAGVNPSSGVWLRILFFGLIYVTLCAFLMLHLKKIEQDPSLSPSFTVDEPKRATLEGSPCAPENADRLAQLLRDAFAGSGAPLHVNLIRVNEVAERNFVRGSAESAARFAARLEKRGITATVRRRLGADVNAACGQLRRSRKKTEESN